MSKATSLPLGGPFGVALSYRLGEEADVPFGQQWPARLWVPIGSRALGALGGSKVHAGLTFSGISRSLTVDFVPSPRASPISRIAHRPVGPVASDHRAFTRSPSWLHF